MPQKNNQVEFNLESSQIPAVEIFTLCRMLFDDQGGES